MNKLLPRMVSVILVLVWVASFWSVQAVTSPWLRSARVTNAYTLPVEVRVTYGRYSASANVSSRQLTSATVVFPGDSALFGDASVQLREPEVVTALLNGASGSCAQLTLPIDTVLACAFPSNDTSIPYSYPESCTSMDAPFASGNESGGGFLVLPASVSSSSSAAPVTLAYEGGQPAAGTLVSSDCSP